MNIIRKNPDVMLKKMSLINVLLAAIILNVHTQDNYTSIRSEKYIPVLYVGSSLSVPDLEGNSRKKIINAYAILILEMENVYDKYVYGSEEGAFPFNSEIQFNLTGYNNDDEPIENLFKPELYSLKISNKKPVAELKLNLAKTIITEDNQTMDLNRIDVENIVFTTDNEELTTSARFRLIYDIQIGYDVNNQEDLRCSAPMDLKASKTAYDNKRYTFSWEHTFPFTAYQLQLLRLYNTNGESTDPQNITADIVWSKAALYEIPITEIYDSHGNIILEKSADINLIEGSGYYVWRVRAIGSYENGGSANSSNWGQWSQVPGPSPVTLTGGDPDDPFIYFRNQNLTFKNNKIKETSTYANGLQQVKQSQVYLPSENTTIISQTLNDHSGRPSLTTIPVPVDEKVQKYKTKFTCAHPTRYAGD